MDYQLNHSKAESKRMKINLKKTAMATCSVQQDIGWIATHSQELYMTLETLWSPPFNDVWSTNAMTYGTNYSP